MRRDWVALTFLKQLEHVRHEVTIPKQQWAYVAASYVFRDTWADAQFGSDLQQTRITHVGGRLDCGDALPAAAVRLRLGGVDVQVLDHLRLRDALQLEDVVLLARPLLLLLRFLLLDILCVCIMTRSIKQAARSAQYQAASAALPQHLSCLQPMHTAVEDTSRVCRLNGPWQCTASTCLAGGQAEDQQPSSKTKKQAAYHLIGSERGKRPCLN